MNNFQFVRAIRNPKSYAWFKQEPGAPVLHEGNFHGEGSITRSPFDTVIAEYQEAGKPVIEVTGKDGARFGLVIDQVDRIYDLSLLQNRSSGRTVIAFKSTKASILVQSHLVDVGAKLVEAGASIEPGERETFKVSWKPPASML